MDEVENILADSPCINCVWNDRCNDACNELRLWAIDMLDDEDE